MEKDIIYSKSFKSWFGDWENDPDHSSKVVDKNGKPLIMYHGTFQHFDTFDPSIGREATDIQGIYLTPDMEEASFYGNNVRAFYVNMRNPADSDEAFNIWHKYYIQGDRKAGVKARKDLQSMGYDGIIGDYDLEPDSEYVVFSANQVKSIDNNGNFSKESDNIYENESNKTMSNYTQFFNKYIESKKVNKPYYGKNTIKAVNQYLKSNGYQITDNDIISGCKAISNKLGKNYDSHSGNYGINPTDTARINNILATVFPPKQNTEQQTQPQMNPQGIRNTNPQDNLMNDLAGITMLTKDELRAMASNGPISKVMVNLMKGKINVNSDKKSKNIIKKAIKGVNDTKNIVSNIKTNIDNFVSDSIHPGIKVSNIQIIGTDNVYTSNRSNSNELKNRVFIMQQEDKNGQVKA